MKKIFKLLLAITITFSVFFFSEKTLAETAYLDGTKCLDPGDPRLSAVCGIVKTAMPAIKIYPNETTTVAQKGVEGVSVYLYECDNSSPTCKSDGNLIHSFASTWTNEEGRFYLPMRKLDNRVSIKVGDKNVDATVQSKRRYLVFTCGKQFAGLQIIPSFYNLTELVQEVKCPGFSMYQAPPDKFSFVTDPIRLANQMGMDGEGNELDANGKSPGDPGYINHMTVQTYFGENTPNTELNIDLKLTGADPRFTEPKEAESALLNTYSVDHPTLGAYWSLDCLEKYDGTPYVKYCMGFKQSAGGTLSPNGNEALKSEGLGVKDGNIYFLDAEGNFSNDSIYTLEDFNKEWMASNGTALPRAIQIAIYEKNLYSDPAFVTQNKLPNISPKPHILFYKEFTARQDLTEYIQDPTDVAHFLHTQFSNCVGDVFLRHDGEEKPDYFAECRVFKECNETLSADNFRNSLTTTGPVKGMASPKEFEEIYKQMDLNTPICVLNPKDEVPIKLGQIQPPYDPNSSGYTLDSSYWNPEFLFYFGSNNLTAKQGWKFENKEDSYSTAPDAANKAPFRAYNEADGLPPGGGTSATITSGGKRPNNTLVGAVAISTENNKFGLTLPLTNFLSPPTKDEDYVKEIMSGTSIYTLTGKPKLLGEYSNVNFPSEMLITNPDQDVAALNNADFKGNEDHYPFQDLVPDASPFNVLDTLKSSVERWVDTITGPSAEDVKNYAADMNFGIKDNEVYKYNVIDEYYYHDTLDNFTEENKDAIIDYKYQSATQAYDKEGARDGTRTPTSAIYMTSAAFARHLAYQMASVGLIKPATPSGGDFYDSLLTTMYGEGTLNFGLNSAVLTGFKSFFDALNGQIGSITAMFNDFKNSGLDINKSFLDRKNADAHLGNPGLIDDLKAGGFLISEENFLEEFPLPEIGNPSYGLNKVFYNQYLFPDDWGGKTSAATKCYPWNPMPLGKRCETADSESTDKISRTCRADKCTRTTTTVTCECSRNTSIDLGDVDYIDIKKNSYDITTSNSYTVSCPENVKEATVEISDTLCSETMKTDIVRRLICAQRQTTCISQEKTLTPEEVRNLEAGSKQAVTVPRDTKAEKDCIRNTYAGDIKGKMNEMERNDNLSYCNASSFNGVSPLVSQVNISAQVHASTQGASISANAGTPSCIVSRAGPNTCDGDLTRTSKLGLNQQIIRQEDDAIDVDPVFVADNELRLNFEAPPATKITYTPAAFVTGESSIRNTEIKEVSKRKDTFGPGGAGSNGSVLRSMFGEPIAFDNFPVYNPVSFHCINDDLGTAGLWECNFEATPDPEIINISALKTEPSCSLNKSQKCADLILGVGNAGFSNTFFKIISAAATEFKIPASMILAYMNGVGKATAYSYYWSNAGEADLFKVSAPWYGTFSKCDDVAPSAQGPYDWLLGYFSLIKNERGGGIALDKLSNGRSQTASRCNFLDATYVTAANLSNGDGGSCSSWSWSTLTKERLYTMTFGGDRVGAYAQDSRYEGGITQEIFEACKN